MRELSLHILDLAQNSISAGAALITIEIAVHTGEQRMTIVIEDNGRGMDEKTVQNVTDPFYTTRSTRKVGLGIPFFQMAAEMTGGSVVLHSQVGKGTVIKGDFYYGHIDCMPLGDICETICTLVQLNPKIDFIYRLIVDGNQFEADTRTLKEVLEDVSIDAPQILAFLREYLQNGTTEVLKNLTL